MDRQEFFNDFSDYLYETHGLDVSAEDLEFLTYLTWQQTNHREAQLATEPVPEVYADVGKAIGFIAGAVLGAFFLPGLGIAAGWFTGAVIGGAIGYRLVSLFDSPASSTSTTSTDPIYQFSGTGSLAYLNTAITVIYANRNNNPSGGMLRREAPLIYTKIKVQQGIQILERLTLLAPGVLGHVNQSGLQLNDLALTNFGSSDVTTDVTPGLYAQPLPGGVSDYSQAVIVSANNYCGIGKSGKFTAGRTGSTTAIAWQGAIGATVSGSQLIKTAPNPGWDASARAGNPVTIPSGYYGAYAEISAIGHAASQYLGWGLGFATPGGGGTPTEMGVAAGVLNSNFLIWVNGALFASSPLGNNGDGLEIRIRVYQSNINQCYQIFFNGGEVYRGTIANPITQTMQGWAFLHYPPNSVDSCTTSAYRPSGDSPIQAGLGRRFQVSSEGLSLFKISNTYIIGGQKVQCVGRSNTGYWVEFDTELIWLADIAAAAYAGAPPTTYDTNYIYTYYSATLTTSKKVNQIDITVAASTYAQDSSGKYVNFAQVFDVWISSGTVSKIRLGRFIIWGNDTTTTLHTLSIRNIPRDYYSVYLEPIPGIGSGDTTPIHRLQQANSSNTVLSPVLLAAGGQPVYFICEADTTETIANANTYLQRDNKATTSGDSSPTLQVTHINEVVTIDGDLTPLTYPNYTVAYSKLLASYRLQSAPTESWDIEEGQVIPNYLWSGRMWGAGPGANRVTSYELFSEGNEIGTIIRQLGGATCVITNTPAFVGDYPTCNSIDTTITTNGRDPIVTVSPAVFGNILLWMPVADDGAHILQETVVIAKIAPDKLMLGTRYGQRVHLSDFVETWPVTFNRYLPKVDNVKLIAYKKIASNYFPDCYVDRLINPISGLGNYVDEDRFIDYESIVYSRKFCVRNKYFYDAVISDGSFEDWAIAAAPSSLLFCTQIEGKYALIPCENDKPDYLFNASNTIKYTEAGTPWQQEMTNTILVKYKTNLDRERQLKVQTNAAYLGNENEIVQTIEAAGVTSVAQAEKVAQVALKSLRLQTRTCQIETDVSSGLYTRQGKIVRTQHTQIEYLDEASGFISKVGALTNVRQLVAESIAIVVISNDIVKLASRHNMRLVTAQSTTDAVSLSGSTATNGSYLATAITVVDEFTLRVTGIGNGAGGTLSIRRTYYDQTIEVSDPTLITASSVGTFLHRDTRITEIDRSISSVNPNTINVIAIESALSVGDAYAIGALSTFYRKWRITSVHPDVKSNKVTLTGVLWDANVLSPSGLTTIDGLIAVQTT